MNKIPWNVEMGMSVNDYNLPGLGLECIICVYLWTGGESAHIHLLASTPVSSLPGMTKSHLPEQERGYLSCTPPRANLDRGSPGPAELSDYQFGSRNFYWSLMTCLNPTVHYQATDSQTSSTRHQAFSEHWGRWTTRASKEVRNSLSFQEALEILP